MATNTRSSGETSDDVLWDVFARLPGLQDLLRCVATCRRWRRLVTDRDFLRRLGFWPDTARRPSVLVGIFSQNTVPAGPVVSLPKRKSGCPPQFLSLQAGDAARLAFSSFVADDHDGLFDLARPLASRRGLLLARVLPPDGFRDGQRLHLAVCRPLVDKRSTRLLPSPPFDLALNENVTGCALLTGADHDDGNLEQQQLMPAFQVLLLCAVGGGANSGFVCASAYSSATGIWGAPIRCCRAGLRRSGPSAGVVARGTVHWLFTDDEANLYTLDISMSTCPTPTRVSLTKIPIKVPKTVPWQPSPVPCIAEEDGMLAIVNIRDNGVLELWTNQDHDHGGLDGGWSRSHLTDLGSKWIDLVFFAESRRALLVEQGGVFFTVDRKSKEKTPLVYLSLREEETGHVKGRHWFPAENCTSTWCCGHGGYGLCGLRPPPVLYEMDWVFSRRLFLTSSD